MNSFLQTAIYVTPPLVIIIYWLRCAGVLKTLQSMQRPALIATSKQQRVLVIIPFCNELQHLPYLIEDLTNLERPSAQLTIVFVNDHSTDHSEKYVSAHLPRSSIFQFLDSSHKPGKKNAILFALDQLPCDLFCTLDADVRIPRHWLTNMLANYNYNEPSLVIGQIRMGAERQWMRRLQFTEWLLLQGLTMSTALRNRPIMCNGASLLIDRASFEQVGGYSSHQQLESGDDYYTLLLLKSLGENSVKLQCESECAVEIHPVRTWSELWKQRLRWARKRSLFTDPQVRSWGLVVMSANVVLLLCAFASPFVPYFTHLYFGLLGFKCMADYPIAEWVAKNRNQKLNEMDLVMLNLFYPFFSLVVALASLFIKPKWKHAFHK